MAIFTEKGFYFKLLRPNPFPDQLTAFAYFAMLGAAKTHHNNSAQEIHLIPKKKEKGIPPGVKGVQPLSGVVAAIEIPKAGKFFFAQ